MNYFLQPKRIKGWNKRVVIQHLLRFLTLSFVTTKFFFRSSFQNFLYLRYWFSKRLLWFCCFVHGGMGICAVYVHKKAFQLLVITFLCTGMLFIIRDAFMKNQTFKRVEMGKMYICKKQLTMCCRRELSILFNTFFITTNQSLRFFCSLYITKAVINIHVLPIYNVLLFNEYNSNFF